MAIGQLAPVALALLVAATGLLSIAVVALRRIPPFLLRAHPREIRTRLLPELVSSVAILLAVPAVARQVAHFRLARDPDAPDIPLDPSLWPLAGIPAATAAVAVGILAIRTRPSVVPATTPIADRRDAPLRLLSALIAGSLTLLLALAGRANLIDALLIGAAFPAWLWLLIEWPLAPRRDEPQPSHDHRPPTPPSPGALLLLLALLAAAALAYLSLFPPLAFGVEIITAAILLALLIPLVRTASTPDIDPPRADWAAAPIFLLATIPTLFALAAATITRVVLVVDHAGDETHLNGYPWHTGAAEALAAMPYLPGLARLTTPTLLALALPLLHLALSSVSTRIRRLAGCALLLAGVALAATRLVSP